MQRVEEYEFGRIKIGERMFKNDIIICGDEILEKWWRKEGHRLSLDDLKWLKEKKFEILVIGTGYYGIMKVDKDVISYFKERGIEVIVKDSKEAVKEYNNLIEEGKKAALAIHLTC